MKCPNCNEEILDTYRFCPKCRTRIVASPIETKSESPIKETPANKSNNMDSFVKGRAIFSLSLSVIARKIKESEFAQMDALRGFIIEDGVKAILYINGEIAEIKGGSYDLVDPSQIKLAVDMAIAKDKQTNSGFFAQVKRFWSSIKNFVLRKKNSDSSELLSEQRIDEIVRNLSKDTIVSLFLSCERNFNIIIGNCHFANGSVSYRPLRVHTKYIDADMGVCLSLRISNTRDFIANIMQGHDTVSPYMIQEMLSPYVNAILEEEMANTVVENHQIDSDVKKRIISRILDLSSVMKGIEIVGVVDVTCNANDLERFRNVARELYLSDKEMDYMQRSNELKNRMANMVNSQKLNEARNEFELRKAMDEINKDDLLQKDEMDTFVEQLALSKFKREISLDELRMEQIADSAIKKLDLGKTLLHHDILNDAETDDLKYEIYKKRKERQLDDFEFELALYGKKYIIEKQKLDDAWKREDELMLREYKKKMFEADSDIEFLKKKVEKDSLTDDYTLNKTQRDVDFTFNNARRQDEYEFDKKKRQEDYSFDSNKRRDDYDFAKKQREQALQWETEQQRRELDMRELQQAQQMSMQNMKAMVDLDMQLSNNEHRNRMEADNAQKAFDLEKERMRHEEQINKDNLEFQLGMQQSDNLTRMGADQIAASQLSKLTTEQAAAFSEMFSSRKEAKVRDEMLQFANERNQQNRDDMQQMMNQNRQDMQNMMSMMMQGMQNMANMNMQNIQSMANMNVQSAQSMAGMNMQTQQNMMQMQQSAMQQQINDTKQMKEEYRQQAIHQQERTDQNQQQSLNYTTLVQTNGASAGAKDNKKENENKDEKK